MNEYILVIDAKDEIKALVDDALSGVNAKVLVSKDVNSAKRKLVQAVPCIILSVVNIDGDSKAGINLCHQLREHSEFSKIPLVLFSDSINDEILQQARVEGAKAVVPFSVLSTELRKFLNSLLPNIVPKPAEVKQVNKSTQSQITSGSNVADLETQEKIEIAQRLMAKVLHNLKTSDLLQVVDKDEVAQVVYEMTRSVCGISSSVIGDAIKKDITKSECGLGGVDDQRTDVDLSEIFGKR